MYARKNNSKKMEMHNFSLTDKKFLQETCLKIEVSILDFDD